MKKLLMAALPALVSSAFSSTQYNYDACIDVEEAGFGQGIDCETLNPKKSSGSVASQERLWGTIDQLTDETSAALEKLNPHDPKAKKLVEAAEELDEANDQVTQKNKEKYNKFKAALSKAKEKVKAALGK